MDLVALEDDAEEAKMKKSAGRKERRMLARRNRRAEGRKRAKMNEIEQKKKAKESN